MLFQAVDGFGLHSAVTRNVEQSPFRVVLSVDAINEPLRRMWNTSTLCPG